MRSRTILLVAFAFVIAGCGGDGSTATTTAEDTTTTEPSTSSQDTSTPPESSSSTEAPSEETTTTAAAGGETLDVQFGITGIDFEAGTIEITNVGSEAADLGGWWLCQRPSYFQIGSVMLEPGEAHLLEGTTVDGLDPADGELGLYLTNAFNEADQIVSYLEWGSSGHGRSSVAVAAGIWPEGGFVATDASTARIVTDGSAVADPAGWSIQ